MRLAPPSAHWRKPPSSALPPAGAVALLLAAGAGDPLVAMDLAVRQSGHPAEATAVYAAAHPADPLSYALVGDGPRLPRPEAL